MAFGFEAEDLEPRLFAPREGLVAAIGRRSVAFTLKATATDAAGNTGTAKRKGRLRRSRYPAGNGAADNMSVGRVEG